MKCFELLKKCTESVSNTRAAFCLSAFPSRPAPQESPLHKCVVRLLNDRFPRLGLMFGACDSRHLGMFASLAAEKLSFCNTPVFGQHSAELQRTLTNTIAGRLALPKKFLWPTSSGGRKSGDNINQLLWSPKGGTHATHSVSLAGITSSTAVYSFEKGNRAVPQQGGGLLFDSITLSYVALLHTVKSQGLYRCGGSRTRLSGGSDLLDKLVIYCSDQVDPHLTAVARLLGFVHVRTLLTVVNKTARNYSLSVEELKEKIGEDLGNGLFPALVVGVFGSQCSGGVDPLEEMSQFCAATGVWFHIDASYGIFGLLQQEGEALGHSFSQADSVCVALSNPALPGGLARSPGSLSSVCLFVADTRKVAYCQRDLLEARTSTSYNHVRDTARDDAFGFALPTASPNGLLQLSVDLLCSDREKEMQHTQQCLATLQQLLHADGRFDCSISSSSFGFILFKFSFLSDEQTEQLADEWIRVLSEGDALMSLDVYVRVIVLQRRVWIALSTGVTSDNPVQDAKSVYDSLKCVADGACPSA
ncbi:hypothetical protein AGDE_08852 [Angomonas deanei]|nr:hypothetical protein AGDE_08852 [Angomonas deanei]|eukprot:EPY32127.1 hypothetical protein AGDE_08852 [Angomonas deanei]